LHTKIRCTEGEFSVFPVHTDGSHGLSQSVDSIRGLPATSGDGANSIYDVPTVDFDLLIDEWDGASKWGNNKRQRPVHPVLQWAKTGAERHTSKRRNSFMGALFAAVVLVTLAAWVSYGGQPTAAGQHPASDASGRNARNHDGIPWPEQAEPQPEPEPEFEPEPEPEPEQICASMPCKNGGTCKVGNIDSSCSSSDDFNRRMRKLNGACCTSPQQCPNGTPNTCSTQCAKILAPLYNDCLAPGNYLANAEESLEGVRNMLKQVMSLCSSGHRRAQDQSGSYTCECQPQWTGVTCERPSAPPQPPVLALFRDNP
jgi:hypothetical protein